MLDIASKVAKEEMKRRTSQKKIDNVRNVIIKLSCLVLSKIMEYPLSASLCLFTYASTILNIHGLSRPKSSRNLSSDRLETKYESCEK